MSKDVKKTEGLTRLHQLTAAEVSLVPTGANKRRFLIFKSSKKLAEGRVGLAQRIREKVLKADPAVMSKVREIIQRHNVKGQESGVNVFGMQDGAGKPGPVNEQGMTPGTKDGVEGAGDPAKGSIIEKDGGLNDMPENDQPAGGVGSGAAGGGLSKQAEAALTAVVRILTPFKQEIPSDLLNDVLEVSGFQAPANAQPGTTHAGNGKPPGEHYEPKEAAFEALPAMLESEEDDFLEGVTKDHMMEAAVKAEDCYKEHLEKLGYQKYPVAKMGMKRGGGAAKEEMGEETVTKSGSATPGLAEIKDPHTRRVLEAVQKSNLELVKKNSDLEKSLADQRAGERKKEIVMKAGSFKYLGLPQDDLVAQLLDADKLGTESYERVVKSFSALDAQARDGKLFSEFGSSHGSNGGAADADAKLWTLADGIVQKSSGKKLTREEAYGLALQTPEGQRFYAQYKAERPHGI